jgi:hypothetical protein
MLEYTFIYCSQANKSERQKGSPTYKDLDFMEHHSEGIFLEADTYTALIKTMQRDCRVLESFKVCMISPQSSVFMSFTMNAGRLWNSIPDSNKRLRDSKFLEWKSGPGSSNI